MQTVWEQRFFSSTRGRLVAMLRRAAQTVDELAHALDLTDNAVRAHLATLERDGLVRQEGVRRGPGSGKPAFSYGLTAHAENLFPKAYGELLRHVLLAVSQRLPSAEVEAILREVAHRLADGHSQAAESLPQRVDNAVGLLNDLGGLAESHEEDGTYHIQGCSCPLAAVLPDNPKACRLAELLLEDVIGANVHERCEREPSPHCHFEISSRAS